MKKLYIFDLDGTLLDTITDVGLCFNKSLSFFGFPIHDLEDYPKYVGGNLETNISRLLPDNEKNDENIKKIKDYFEKTYLDDPKINTKPFKGILKLLKDLNKKGIMIAIHTNKKENLAKEVCNEHFSDINFVQIVGYKEGTPHKPSPSKVYDIINFAKVSKNETIYIGDSNTDIETAKNADIPCYLVEWGQGKPEDFKNEYVTKIIRTPEELMDI